MAIPKLQAYALPEASDIPANKVNWAFEPSRAALLIHDMQEYFLNFWGENSAMMEKVVANIAALRDFCKQNGIPVYYTAQPKEQSDEDRALLNDMWGPGLTRSPEQQQVIAALAPDEDDTVLVKWRYSAFHRSPLEEMLKETGRDQLIITGVYAHIGCMTTATDAFMRDIKPFFVADALAKFLKIHAREVSFAGQKDKHAVTEQWLCARVPGKEMPDLSKFQLEGCQVLEYARHKRKLRLGALKGNQFTVILREISDRQDVETRLQAIAERGVPNYFGAQRFGIGGSNLQGALRWAESGAPVRDRNKRSFWLSAARSALFNQQVSIRLKKTEFNQVVDGDALQLAGRGSWFVVTPEELEVSQARVHNRELMITATLPGSGDWGSQRDALAFEQAAIAEETALQALLVREKVEAARRAMLLYPQQLSWNWWDDVTVELRFWLPAGSFATSVVRELINTTGDYANIAE